MEKDILLITLPVLSAVISSYLTYYFAIKKTRQEAIFKFKEEKYTNIILALQGFVNGTTDGKMKESLFTEKYKTWLYAPDNVIKAIDDFIDFVREHHGEDGKEHLGKIVLEMRKDLLGRSKLSTEDIKFYHVVYDK